MTEQKSSNSRSQRDRLLLELLGASRILQSENILFEVERLEEGGEGMTSLASQAHLSTSGPPSS